MIQPPDRTCTVSVGTHVDSLFAFEINHIDLVVKGLPAWLFMDCGPRNAECGVAKESCGNDDFQHRPGREGKGNGCEARSIGHSTHGAKTGGCVVGLVAAHQGPMPVKAGNKATGGRMVAV